MSRAAIVIERRDRVTHGDYIARVRDSDCTGKLNWTSRGGIRHAEHTFVSQECRGRGIAEALVKAMVADARRLHFKIAPDCAYVDQYFKRHAELSDLRA